MQLGARHLLKLCSHPPLKIRKRDANSFDSYILMGLVPRSLSKTFRVIELARGLITFEKDLHAFQRDRKRTYKFSKINVLRKKAAVSLFSKMRIKYLIFNLYLPLHCS